MNAAAPAIKQLAAVLNKYSEVSIDKIRACMYVYMYVCYLLCIYYVLCMLPPMYVCEGIIYYCIHIYILTYKLFE